MKRREKTAAETRRAARGTVPGFLGMAEIAKLKGKPCKLCDGTGKRITHPAGWVEDCFACQPVRR